MPKPLPYKAPTATKQQKQQQKRQNQAALRSVRAPKPQATKAASTDTSAQLYRYLLQLGIPAAGAIAIIIAAYMLSSGAYPGMSSTLQVADPTTDARLPSPSLPGSSLFYFNPSSSNLGNRQQRRQAERETAKRADTLTPGSSSDSSSFLTQGLTKVISAIYPGPSFSAAAAATVTDLPRLELGQPSDVNLDTLKTLSKSIPKGLAARENLGQHLFAHCMQGDLGDKIEACPATGQYFATLAEHATNAVQHHTDLHNPQRFWTLSTTCFAQAAFYRAVSSVTPEAAASLAAWAVALHHKGDVLPARGVFKYIANMADQKYKPIVAEIYAGLLQPSLAKPLNFKDLQTAFLRTSPFEIRPNLLSLPFHHRQDLELEPSLAASSYSPPFGMNLAAKTRQSGGSFADPMLLVLQSSITHRLSETVTQAEKAYAEMQTAQEAREAMLRERHMM